MFRAVAILFGLLIACVTLEVGFHFFSESPSVRRLERMDITGWPTYSCFASNPHGEFSELPDVSEGKWLLGTLKEPVTMFALDKLEETPWCVENRFSSIGLRDREYSPTPEDGKRRIVCIGDSFVFGFGVPIDKTLTREAERLLGPGYELVNGGAPGADTDKEMWNLSQLLPLTNPHRVILVFLANDIRNTPELAAREEQIHAILSHGMDKWYARSALVRFVLSRIAMRRAAAVTLQWYRDRYDPQHNQENLDRMAAQFRALAARKDLMPVLVLYPIMEGLESEYPLADVHARVATMAQLAGLPVLDLAPAFQGQQTTSMWVHDSDHHPNGNAHAIAAKSLVEWLSSLPGFLDGSP